MMLKLEGLLCVALISLFVGLGSASDCCSSYTNPITGKHVDGKFCPEYCCIQLSLNMYDCCDDQSKQAPAQFRDEDCGDWLKEHIWVPIVGTIIVIVILIALCTCCCCCGCCACCRRNKTPVIIHGGGFGQPSNVVVSNQTQMVPTAQAQDPVHFGYDQN